MSAQPVPSTVQAAIIAETTAPGEKPLWRARAVASTTGGHLSGDFACTSVAMQIAEVTVGSLYFARGEIDARAARARGATGVVCEHKVPTAHVLVEDMNTAIAALARAARSRTKAVVTATIGFGDDAMVPGLIFQALDRASRGDAWRAECADGLDAGMVAMAADLGYALYDLQGVAGGERLRPHLLVAGPETPRAEGLALAGAIPAGGAAVLPSDHVDFPRWRAAALDNGAQVFGYGRKASSDICLLDTIAGPAGGRLVTADMMGSRMCYQLGDRGLDPRCSLAVLGAMRAAGASYGAAALALAA